MNIHKIHTVNIPCEAEGKLLLHFLRENGYHIAADCGGKGTCSKCRVHVASGTFTNADSGKPLAPDADGFVLSCKAVCTKHGAQVEVEISDGGGITNTVFSAHNAAESAYGTPAKPQFAMALDIGTTTLALALVNTSTRETVAKKSCLNPQRSYGADVMSRITACRNGETKNQQTAILSAVKEMSDALKSEHPDCIADELFVSGNTTMLHIFSGVSPESMGTHPFTPVFTHTRVVDGAELGLDFNRITLLASASAFIGADITAGVFASGMTQHKECTMLIDIGTNGEIVLFNSGRIFTASAAAGPALEGATLSCGTGGVDGAVNRVFAENGTLKYTTLSNLKPRGICASGVVDFVAELLRSGRIDSTGCLENERVHLTGAHVSAEGTVLSAAPTGISVTQKDIREIQLAKAALSAAIFTVLKTAGLAAADVQRVYLSGGIGSCINVESAVTVGILPAEFAQKTVCVGNSALSGAILATCDNSAIEEIEAIASRCENVELSQSPLFSQRFVEEMEFRYIACK